MLFVAIAAPCTFLPRPASEQRAIASQLTDLDLALVQQILDVSQRKWESDIEYHRQANDLGARLEVLEVVGLVIWGR